MTIRDGTHINRIIADEKKKTLNMIQTSIDLQARDDRLDGLNKKKLKVKEALS